MDRPETKTTWRKAKQVSHVYAKLTNRSTKQAHTKDSNTVIIKIAKDHNAKKGLNLYDSLQPGVPTWSCEVRNWHSMGETEEFCSTARTRSSEKPVGDRESKRLQNSSFCQRSWTLCRLLNLISDPPAEIMDTIQDLVVPLDRNLYGHTSAGLLWGR